MGKSSDFTSIKPLISEISARFESGDVAVLRREEWERLLTLLDPELIGFYDAIIGYLDDHGSG